MKKFRVEGSLVVTTNDFIEADTADDAFNFFMNELKKSKHLNYEVHDASIVEDSNTGIEIEDFGVQLSKFRRRL